MSGDEVKYQDDKVNFSGEEVIFSGEEVIFSGEQVKFLGEQLICKVRRCVYFSATVHTQPKVAGFYPSNPACFIPSC